MVGIEAGWPSLPVEADGAALGVTATDQPNAPFLVARQLCRGLPLTVGLSGFGDLSACLLQARTDEPLNALAVSHADHRQVSYAEVGRRDTKTHRARPARPLEA